MCAFTARFSKSSFPMTKAAGSSTDGPIPKSESQVESGIRADWLESVSYRSKFSAPGKPSILQKYLLRDGKDSSYESVV